ncbi:MAG: TPM domain-containing protein [Gorillibacterium sp.]|nr:TPM domain-containing protein [Gorillibacterium sp.]
MKKGLVFILMLVWMLAVQPALAATIPAQTGRVMDTAGMFTAEQIVSVEQATEGQDYSFHLLTIDRLDGVKPTDYADQVYKAWNLQKQDILLLVSLNDRQTALSFKNQELLAKLDAKYGLGDASISQIITDNFNDYAKQGNYAAGSIALMQAVYQLPALTNIPSGTGTIIEPAPAVPNAVNSGPEATSQPVPVTVPAPDLAPAKTAGNNVLVFFGIVLLFSVIAWVGYGIYLNRKLKQVKVRTQFLLVEISRATEQLRPFVGLVQGSTEQLVIKADERLSSLTVELSAHLHELAEQSILILKIEKLRKAIQEAEAKYSQFTAALQEGRDEVKRVVEVDKEVKQEVKELLGLLTSLEADIENLHQQHTFPLEYLYAELDRLKKETAKASDLSVFDPIEGDKVADRALLDMESRQQDMLDLPRYLDAHRSFAERAGSSRAEIAQIIRDNTLKLPRTDPFASLEKAQGKAPSLLEALQAGRMEQARTISGEMDSLLASAIEMTRRQAQLKDKNQQDIRWIEGKLTEFEQNEPDVKRELERVRKTYAEEHAGPLMAAHEKQNQRLRVVEGNLPQIRRLTDEEHQEFDQARVILDENLAQLSEADTIAKQAIASIQEWDTKLAEFKRQTEEYRDRFATAVRLIELESLKFHEEYSIQEHSKSIIALQSKVQSELSSPPYRLVVIEQMIQQQRKETERFATVVQEADAKKKQAEELARAMNDQFTSVHGRTKSMLLTDSYKSRYSGTMNDFQALIAAGYYQRAMEKANEVNSLISGMEHDYRTEVAKQESVNSGSSSWNDSSGGNSSGSSSWDSGSSSGSSDSNSSGSSGW